MKTSKTSKIPKPIRKEETLKWVIEAIDRKAHYALKPGDSALKLLKKWR